MLYTTERLSSFGYDVPKAWFCGYHLESLEHLFFSCPLAQSGIAFIQSLLVSAAPLAPTIDVRHVLFGFNSDEFRIVPRVFCYVLNVCKFLMWSQCNDFRFRAEPPAAVKLLATLKSRLSFHLPCSQSVLCPTVVVVTSLDSGVLGVSLDPFMDPLSKCVSNVGPFGYIIKFVTALTVAFIGCTVGVFFVCSYLAVTHFIWISWSPSLVVL